MKRELVPFNDMCYVPGSLEVYRFHSWAGFGWAVLANIRDPRKTVKVEKVMEMKYVSIGGINVGDAFDKFYDIEETDELPSPDELDEMKTLGGKMGLEGFVPIDLSKVLQMYYNIMELADDFDFEDPYDRLEKTNQ